MYLLVFKGQKSNSQPMIVKYDVHLEIKVEVFLQIGLKIIEKFAKNLKITIFA